MTPEQLDTERAEEALRRWKALPNCDNLPTVAQIAARLARENWTPPEPVDPDLEAARIYANRLPATPEIWNARVLAFRAGCTRGREEAKGLVEAPFRLYDRVQRKWQFGDAIGSIMAMQRFDHGWECWVHVAAYGSNSIIQADDLRFVAHAPDALAAAKGKRA